MYTNADNVRLSLLTLISIIVYKILETVKGQTDNNIKINEHECLKGTPDK